MQLRDLLQDKTLPVKVRYNDWPKSNFFEAHWCDEDLAYGMYNGTQFDRYFLDESGWELYKEEPELDIEASVNNGTPEIIQLTKLELFAAIMMGGMGCSVYHTTDAIRAINGARILMEELKNERGR